MEIQKNQMEKQIGNEHLSEPRRRAINQLAFGSVILLWGFLLILKQIGIIERTVSTWPYPLAVFGIMLIAGSIYRLSRSRRT